MEPKTKYNLDRICRICLSECSEMTDVFDNRRKISQMLMTCSDVKVVRNDGLPAQICSPCVKQAHLAVRFKYKCEQSDARLRNYITNTLNVPSSILDIKEELSAFEDLSDFLKYEIPLSTVEDIRTAEQDDNAKNITTNNLPTYECAICKEVYDSTKLLIDHVIRVHTASVKEEIESFSCNICRKKFNEEFDLKCHQITHKDFAVNNKINTCPLCREHFPKHEVLLRHVGYHLDDSEYGCTKCNCFYTSNLHLKRHNQRMHPPVTKTSSHNSDAVTLQNDFTVKTEPETISDDIEMPFDTSYPSDDNDFSLTTDDFTAGIDLQLNDSHNNDNSNDSDYDANKLLSEMIGKSHKKHHKNKRKSGKDIDIKIEPEDVESLENILNDKKSYSKDKSKKRKKKGSKTNPAEKDLVKIGKKFSCNQCPKKFLKKELLTDHIRHHSGERSYLCSKCGKGYFKQLHLDKHMATHLNDHVEKPLHVCPLCGKVVKHSNHLQSHMKTHNGKGVEPQSINPNKKTHLCSTCGRSCSSLSNLAVHMRRHTGTMTCVCKICDKGYPRTTDLILHMRQHTGERPFVCYICNKGFARSDKLAIHMRTHTGEKPYTCNSCGRAFAQSNDLGAHKKRNNCGQNQNATPNISRSGIITGLTNNLSGSGNLLNESHLVLLSQNKALHVSSVDSSQNPDDISNKLKRNVSNQHSKALSLANNVNNLGGNEDQQLLVSAAHTRAFELAAAAAVSNNLLLVSNNAQNKVMDLADVQQIRNVASTGKQNLTVSGLMATQRALELANHNSILAQQQRAEYTDYTAATLLQVQSAHFLLNKLNE